MRPRVTLTYGLRMDAPQYPDKPNANPVAVSSFGYATDVVPNDVQWSPRVGVNWTLNDTNTAQFRAGVGIFTGRPAYVWISNQFGNTGIDFTRIGAGNNANNRIPFVADPLNQPTTVTGATGGHVQQRDRHDRSELQLSVDPARQPRRRHAAAGRPGRHRRLRVVEDDARTSSTRTSTWCSCRA